MSCAWLICLHLDTQKYWLNTLKFPVLIRKAIRSLFIRHLFGFGSQSACLVSLVISIIESAILLTTKVTLIVRIDYKSALTALSIRKTQFNFTAMVIITATEGVLC